MCSNEQCDVWMDHMAGGPHCIDNGMSGTVHQCADARCNMCSKLEPARPQGKQVSSRPDLDHVLSGGQGKGLPVGAGQPGNLAGSGGEGTRSRSSSSTDLESTSRRYPNLPDTIGDDIEREVSRSTCSSLIREVTKIKAEDLEASLIRSDRISIH